MANHIKVQFHLIYVVLGNHPKNIKSTKICTPVSKKPAQYCYHNVQFDMFQMNKFLLQLLVN